MTLVEIRPPEYDIVTDIAYATPRNITGKPVYARAGCYLHRAAAEKLQLAIAIARPFGLKLKIFDAFRPSEAQWVLWKAKPDPNFLADPRKGSPHSRGVALDLTLIDSAGRDLDMGTPYDAFTPLSYHGVTNGIGVEAQRNRLVLLGIMTSAGWDFYRNEWWHYQLFNARSYPLIADSALSEGLMGRQESGVRIQESAKATAFAT